MTSACQTCERHLLPDRKHVINQKAQCQHGFAIAWTFLSLREPVVPMRAYYILHTNTNTNTNTSLASYL
jgi:hypothetical protein